MLWTSEYERETQGSSDSTSSLLLYRYLLDSSGRLAASDALDAPPAQIRWWQFEADSRGYLYALGESPRSRIHVAYFAPGASAPQSVMLPDVDTAEFWFIGSPIAITGVLRDARGWRAVQLADPCSGK